MTTLQEAKAYPLGDDDINKILEPDTHIFTYPYLKQVKDIDEIFDPYGRAMMLYLTENSNTGHWVCLIRRPDEIEFFDPYGEGVDKQLSWVGKGKRMELEQERPLLSKLLREKGLPVVYNKTKFQKVDDDIATCGRHCVIRLLFKDLPLPKYAEMIKTSGMTPDEFVTRKTYDLLGK
jgi:hypothetical protein